MKLIIIGCEYSGTSTLARNVFDWVNEKMDGGMLLFHDHWKIPFTSGHQEFDLPLSLDDEELERSKIRNKITLDSGAGTPEETLAEFLKQYEPFMSDSDKVRILVNKAKQSGDWL